MTPVGRQRCIRAGDDGEDYRQGVRRHAGIVQQGIKSVLSPVDASCRSVIVVVPSGPVTPYTVADALVSTVLAAAGVTETVCIVTNAFWRLKELLRFSVNGVLPTGFPCASLVVTRITTSSPFFHLNGAQGIVYLNKLRGVRRLQKKRLATTAGVVRQVCNASTVVTI